MHIGSTIRDGLVSSLATPTSVRLIPTEELNSSSFSLSVYGDPEVETGGLLDSIRAHGVLVPLVVVRAQR